MKLAEYLQLPEGYEALRFPTTIEIKGPYPAKPVGFPVPYDPQPREWWIEQARKSITP